jgi:glycogen debranching enzyme
MLGQGHNVVTADADGRLTAGRTGFFHHQTRFLSLCELTVAGATPKPTSAVQVGAGRLSAYQTAAPKLAAEAADDHTPKPVLEIEAETHLGERLRLIFRLTNRGTVSLNTTLEWRLSADFEDQTEIESGHAAGPAATSNWEAPATLTLHCQRPGLRHASAVRFRGPWPFHWMDGAAQTELELKPQAHAVVEIEVMPVFDPAFAGELPHHQDLDDSEDWFAGCSRLDAADEAVQAAWRRAAHDLRSLQLRDGSGEERFTPAAGFPHYTALFGRDALMTGWQASLLNPAMLGGAISLVGRWTAETEEPERDAQPGRVLHQRQLDPKALLGKTPFLRYYGDHSASALYLIGIAHAYARSGDRERFLSLRDRALRTLEWMDRYGDRDGDGLYEYKTTAAGKGLKNQGWKDSGEAIVYPDGRIVPDPIVVCEVQALFTCAKAALSAAFRAAGDDRLAHDLGRQAQSARQLFNDHFWMEDEGFVALGLDADKRQIRTLASNAGELLAYGALDQDRARRVAERLMQPDFFSGWGIRTLSAEHPAYNPLGYHLGSVWPCFTALTARGFARHGLTDPFHTLAKALFDASRLFDRNRLPELLGGHARDAAHPHPGLYPNACSPQAWSAGAVILLVDTLVGLKPAAPLGAALIQPQLPEWLPELTLRGISAGSGLIDLRVRRGADGASVCEALANSSGLRLYGPGLSGGSADEIRDLAALVDVLP